MPADFVRDSVIDRACTRTTAVLSSLLAACGCVAQRATGSPGNPGILSDPAWDSVKFSERLNFSPGSSCASALTS